MKPFRNFITEHFVLVLVLAAAIGLFFCGSSFAELKYGFIRTIAVVFTAAVAIDVVFKATVRPYIDSGDFATDFKNHPQRSWMTIAILAVVLWVCTQCFVHADVAQASSLSPFIPLQQSRWDSAAIRPEKIHFAEALVRQIARNRGRYELVSSHTGVPWPVIAGIHNMECSQSFRENLANGDSLTSRTRHVPRGRPVDGHPPFTWETAAIDALHFDAMDRHAWIPRGRLLQNIEAYNGTGYERLHPETPTPYLWSWTTIYTRGKYIEDGRWDPCAISQQCGVAPLLKLLL
ncbi:MAG TPA: hypothetical protein VHW03_06730 [Chthoniobacterales bacterium]|jgi:lysozyme family protein|nr:hypothetical protein [Chthoniobacterales bacterium]